MKKLNKILITASLLAFASSAKAVIIDFQSLADSVIGESAWTTFNTDTDVPGPLYPVDIDITAGPSGSYVYFDHDNAGLGVCSTGILDASKIDQANDGTYPLNQNNCVDGADDNVGGPGIATTAVTESLIFTFNEGTSLNQIWLNNNHDGGSLDGNTVDITVGGTTNQFLFDDLTHKVAGTYGYLLTLTDAQLGFGPYFSATDTLTITFGGNNPSQFYVSAIDVPEPAIVALFGLGLVGIGFARRMRK